MMNKQIIFDINRKIIFNLEFIFKYDFIFYLQTVLVCMFVCLYPINVKTAKPIDFKFYLALATHMTTDRFMNAQK